MGWRIGVDSGGTFTDICLFEETTSRIEIWKTPSTPDDPSRGIAEVVKQGLERVGSQMSELSFFGHGTTVATNALIQLRGVKTALLTTEGFRDLLEIGRQRRPDLYDVMADKPQVLVPRDMRIEVPERLRWNGSIETPVNLDCVRQAVSELRADGVEAIAICFLYSFMDPAHELATGAEIALETSDIFVSLSSEVAPEFREFERLSTTVVNAFLGPVMQRYIRRLETRLQDGGLRVAPHLTQSNGGVIGFEMAAKFPVRTLLSGPSTGVVAAQVIAETAGFDKLITFDMGGTSSDVALLENRVCKRTGEAEVHGYPIKAPMLDIHTVGAGGGSIAMIDSGGHLKVGPESAGADPGPVCYGQGGILPTVTDANVVLQTLNPVEILGGRMQVKRDLAVKAIQGLADQFGLGLHETAQGIISVATANMAKAIRVISVQRGHDPRDYALMAYGGGGPLHAVRLARELDMMRVIVPPTPGTLCALGLLLTDLKADFAKSKLLPLSSGAFAEIADSFLSLEVQADTWFTREGIDRDRQRLIYTADLRYEGQNYELQVPFPRGVETAANFEALVKNFEAAHQQRFGFVVDGEAIELVTLRLEAIGVVNKATLQTEDTVCDREAMPTGQREVWLPEAQGTAVCPIYRRSDLRFGHVLGGPAVVEQMDTTTLILPDMTARVDAHLNLILEPTP